MQTIGEKLEEARKRKGVSVREAAETTKIRGDYLLTDNGTGSRMRLQTTCTARVPIIGGQIEQLIVNGLQTLFAKEGEFTAEWIGGHR